MKKYVAAIAILLGIAFAAKTDDTVRVQTGPRRPDFPLQIAAVAFNNTSLQLLLVNLGSSVVEQVTVGILLQDPTSPTPVTRVGPVCATTLAPGAFLRVATPYTGFAGVDAWFRDRGISERVVAAGVTQVRFSGGMEWNYPLTAKNRFEGESDPEILKRIETFRKQALGLSSPSLFFDPSPAGKAGTCHE